MPGADISLAGFERAANAAPWYVVDMLRHSSATAAAAAAAKSDGVDGRWLHRRPLCRVQQLCRPQLLKGHRLAMQPAVLVLTAYRAGTDILPCLAYLL